MTALTALIICYDEAAEVAVATARALLLAAADLGLTCELMMFDGGGAAGAQPALRDALRNLADGASVPFSAFLPFPAFWPNKNLSVMQAAARAAGRSVAIIDADWANATPASLRAMLAPLVAGEARIVIPDTQLPAGRTNRLVGAPLLRLLYPDLHARVPLPFPGGYAMTLPVLREIVTEDYHWDWGGEIELVIRGAFAADLKIASPSLDVPEYRHRPTHTKKVQALQIFRAGLAMASRAGRIRDYQTVDIEQHLHRYGEEAARFQARWPASGGIAPVLDGLLFETMAGQSPAEILAWCDNLYVRTGCVEFAMVSDLAVRPLIDLLFGIRANLLDPGLTPALVKGAALRDVSILVDLILAALLAIRGRDGHRPALHHSLLEQQSSGLTAMPVDLHWGGGIEVTELDGPSLTRLLSAYGQPVDGLQWEQSRRVGSLLRQLEGRGVLKREAPLW